MRLLAVQRNAMFSQIHVRIMQQTDEENVLYFLQATYNGQYHTPYFTTILDSFHHNHGSTYPLVITCNQSIVGVCAIKCVFFNVSRIAE